ncbi:MAG TPA: transporter [Dissulfurispiraceae bacterium]|nr:transporter [Dissulfurispiraceae bacterium]
MAQQRLGLKMMRFIAVFIALFLAVTTFSSENADATEFGGGAYPNGAEDFMAGALPPPGTYFINYLTYYTADKFKGLKDPLGRDVDFSVDVIANTFRFIHVTKYQILGANWGVQAFLPFLYVDASFPFGSDDKFNIGDIIIDPILLGWHTKNWHFGAGLDIYIPTGDFDKNDLANTGRNYWTFEPVFLFTYLSDGGFEVSSKFMYDFNTENDDTNYQSGQEFHFDYTIGYKIKNWSLGIGGYFYKQTTNDEIDGRKVEPDGFMGRVFAIGPQVKYDYKNMAFTLKYQKELDVKNRPEGDKFWFKFMYAF